MEEKPDQEKNEKPQPKDQKKKPPKLCSSAMTWYSGFLSGYMARTAEISRGSLN